MKNVILIKVGNGSRIAVDLCSSTDFFDIHFFENHFKRMKSRKYIEDLKNYPELGERLIEKYS
jgi:hypothetical protein